MKRTAKRRRRKISRSQASFTCGWKCIVIFRIFHYIFFCFNLQFLSLLHVLKAFYHNHFSHLFNYIFKNNQLFSNSLNRQPKNHLHRRNYATYHYPRMDEISFYNPESRIVYEEKLHNLSDIPSKFTSSQPKRPHE